jgi:hypothetical protein
MISDRLSYRSWRQAYQPAAPDEGTKLARLDIGHEAIACSTYYNFTVAAAALLTAIAAPAAAQVVDC